MSADGRDYETASLRVTVFSTYLDDLWVPEKRARWLDRFRMRNSTETTHVKSERGTKESEIEPQKLLRMQLTIESPVE